MPHHHLLKLKAFKVWPHGSAQVTSVLLFFAKFGEGGGVTSEKRRSHPLVPSLTVTFRVASTNSNLFSFHAVILISAPMSE